MKLVGGFNPTPLKNDKVKVSWDDEPGKYVPPSNGIGMVWVKSYYIRFRWKIHKFQLF